MSSIRLSVVISNERIALNFPSKIHGRYKASLRHIVEEHFQDYIFYKTPVTKDHIKLIKVMGAQGYVVTKDQLETFADEQAQILMNADNIHPRYG